MTCGSCGTENAAGRKFCTECGSALAVTCAACGSSLDGTEKFCGECGTALGATPTADAPAAERRLVSVLFADLVGFTAASADRDAEETRELLSRYFDTCKRLIALYGGTVEKFIGDAVMAVTELEHGEWLVARGRGDEAEQLLAEAREIFERLEATPWIERANAVRPAEAVAG